MATEDEGVEEANNSSGGDRQRAVIDSTERAEIDRTEIDRMVNRKEIVGQLGGSG
jgi:hypothetical protein